VSKRDVADQRALPVRYQGFQAIRIGAIRGLPIHISGVAEAWGM